LNNFSKKYIANYIESHEGRIKETYLDTKGNATIGVGHKQENPQKLVLNDLEIDKILYSDIDAKIKIIINLLPKFQTYPLYVQCAIVDGFFRGDLSGSPKTLKLIKEDKWKEASIEYLNNREYLESKKNKTGVWKRMLENSYHFKNFCEEKYE